MSTKENITDDRYFSDIVNSMNLMTHVAVIKFYNDVKSLLRTHDNMGLSCLIKYLSMLKHTLDSQGDWIERRKNQLKHKRVIYSHFYTTSTTVKKYRRW